jgi:hypothetical protein
MSPRIILIHPPLVKCSEPPPGIAKLSACLAEHDVIHDVIDANLEGLLYLLHHAADRFSVTDKWSRRACKHLETNFTAVRSIATYQTFGRYQRAVGDINRLLTVTGRLLNQSLSLVDYQDKNLSPLRSADLIAAAVKPQSNPFYPYFLSRLTKVMEHHPHYIGLSVNYLSQSLCVFAMIGIIRQFNPDQKIILGGSLVTSWRRLDLLKEKFRGWIDHWIEGPGEQKLLEIMNIRSTGQDLIPEYSRFALDSYLSPGRILPFSTTHGCYWRQCVFCPEKSQGISYKPFDPFAAATNLRVLTEKIHPQLIHILDSSISPAMLNALIKYPPLVPWYGFARVTRHLTDENFCFSLKKSGCKLLKLGIESGDQNVLDQLNKGIDLSTASAALKTLKKSGIATYCYFLFGTPPESEESAVKTMSFVCQHHESIDFLNAAIFNLPALSIEAKELVTHDFYEGDLSLYNDFRHPHGWQRASVRHFLERQFKKNPLIAPLIRRTPPFFTSNHAPFFV